MYALLLLFFALHAGTARAASGDMRDVLLLQMQDAPQVAVGDIPARIGAFEAGASATRDRLVAALPPEFADTARLEALPALNAWLLTLPHEAGARARAALRGAGLPIAQLSLHVGDTALDDLIPMADAPLVVTPRAAAARALALGLIDLGADRAHPAFAGPLGVMHFQPGTPGADGTGHLLRSHGTAMAGIYAQLLGGAALRAGDVEQPWLRLPRAVPVTDTLVAHAGPETPAGRSDLLRALDWMLTPAPDRPRPDVINYSQGNGRLCAVGARCRPERWYGVTRVLDRVVDEQAITLVKSAGNLGDSEDDSGTMTVPGDSWNGITVGNMHAFDWTHCAPSAERAAHKIYRTSSVAPAAPGPRLLDLVAPGVRIGTTGVNPAYCRAVCGQRPGLDCQFCRRLGRPRAGSVGHWKMNSGSSPAAAVVGAVALYLIDEGLDDPRAVKAVLINSADTWTSEGTRHPQVRANGKGCAADVHAASHGPYVFGSHYDRSYGYGYLNPQRAAQQRAFTVTDTVEHSRCYAVRLAAWDKLTLVWHRHLGGGGGMPLTALDLALYDAVEADLVDADRGRPSDNVRQVSNGRGMNSAAEARALIVRIDAAAPERFALASPRALTALAHCPDHTAAVTSPAQ